jgi:hypothetical protein
MNREDLPHVLCVDDEPRIVDGLALHLRRDNHVTTDNGATFLKHVSPHWDIGAERLRSHEDIPGAHAQLRTGHPAGTSPCYGRAQTGALVGRKGVLRTTNEGFTGSTA